MPILRTNDWAFSSSVFSFCSLERRSIHAMFSAIHCLHIWYISGCTPVCPWCFSWRLQSFSMIFWQWSSWVFSGLQ